MIPRLFRRERLVEAPIAEENGGAAADELQHGAVFADEGREGDAETGQEIKQANLA